MRFVVSSTALLSSLQALSRVINNKNTMAILDNFLFELQGQTLIATASDKETTLETSIELTISEGEGSIALPAKILIDTLREFPEQPLVFNINMDDNSVQIKSENGNFQLKGFNAGEYPESPTIRNGNTIVVSPSILSDGIERALFAVGEDEYRPIMNGVMISSNSDGIEFAASDAQKLVRYRLTNEGSDGLKSVVLLKKPASIIRGILPKCEEDCIISYDDSHIFIEFGNYKLYGVLPSGKFPNYASVIPTDAVNKNVVVLEKSVLLNSLKRVSVFSNPGSNLIKVELDERRIVVSAQDIDFASSAEETLTCDYDGDEISIGFKASFLLEILSNIPGEQVMIKLSDKSRPALFLPVKEDEDDTDLVMLLVPMMVNF
ncbi:MAG: DNA polymerase III subunit beta [Marinifilaceae bacterium]|jgi:DNA polymerase-3 subunit beta|nr:DNA polymerase III subunit beta [Marinifilaceae bacterium]